MPGLTDILTTAQNLVQAVNGVGQALARGQGNITSATVTGTTQICTGGGYLVNVSVAVAGTTVGKIYNSATTGAAAAENLLATAPNTLGVVPLGEAFTLGLVITPGSGQSLNVTYFQ